MKKLIALLLALVMVLGMVACGAKAPEAEAPKDDAPKTEAPKDDAPEAAPEEALEEVTLTMYLLGDRPVDNDEVFAKINEKLNCLRCVQVCPVSSRALPAPFVDGATQMLNEKAAGYKKPVVFL